MNKKFNFVFDGTILVNEFSKNSTRSGIFFVAKNIFNELLKREDINLFLYCELSKMLDLKKYLEKYNLNIEIINECEYNFLHKLKKYYYEKKNSYDKKRQPLQRNFLSILYFLFSLLPKIDSKINTQIELRKKLKEMDFYFSPCKKTPLIIRQSKNILSSVYLHDTIPLILPQYFPKFLSGDAWFSDLVKSLNKEELYFANSECTKKDFLKFSNKITENQIEVAMLACADSFKNQNDKNLIEKVRVKYNIPKNKKYIFSLCTLEPRKNLIRAVKTFIFFIEKHKIEDLVFVLGGGHWDMFINELQYQIDNIDKYKNKIIRAGYVEDDDLSVLYSGAEWFVYTSQYEGFGLPTLEAMACGCPVITSNNSSLPEVVGDSAIKIKWDSDDAHIEAYEKYYFNEVLKKGFAQKGIERAKNFSWEKCANIIVERLKCYTSTH